MTPPHAPQKPPLLYSRSTSTRACVGGGSEANDDRGSTHPSILRALIRRHVPRVSPSCTREFGPSDATRRAVRLGAARTITQSFATELTQRADVFAFAAVLAATFASGL